METEFTDPSFDDWVWYHFGRPILDPRCNWSDEDVVLPLEPHQLLQYTTWLFERAGELLAPYSDAQVNQGLSDLVGEGSTELYCLADVTIPISKRVSCILSISAVFEQCFACRCTPTLSHLDEDESSAINSICYMWWDIFPLYGQPEDPQRREIDEACLTVMEQTLRLPSIACQESALHGLGHWCQYYESRCHAITAEFLKRENDLRPELANYAYWAGKGMVQ